MPNRTDPSQVAFFLARQDAIIDSSRVQQYLTEVRNHCSACERALNVCTQRGVSEEKGGLFVDEVSLVQAKGV